MSGLHYKKDGTLDMRYKSSREFVSRQSAAAAPPRPAPQPSYTPASSGLHYRRDGGLDKRYNSSREFIANQYSAPKPAPVQTFAPPPNKS